jgi:hypothetical protein
MKTNVRGATTCRLFSMLRRLRIPIAIGVLASLTPIAVVQANPVVPFLDNVPENILYFFRYLIPTYAVSLGTEYLVAFLLIRGFFKREDISSKKILAAVAVINLLTLTVGWILLYDRTIQHVTQSVFDETVVWVLVFVLEALYYRKSLLSSIWHSALVSAAANAVSYIVWKTLSAMASVFAGASADTPFGSMAIPVSISGIAASDVLSPTGSIQTAFLILMTIAIEFLAAIVWIRHSDPSGPARIKDVLLSVMLINVFTIPGLWILLSFFADADPAAFAAVLLLAEALVVSVEGFFYSKTLPLSLRQALAASAIANVLSFFFGTLYQV